MSVCVHMHLLNDSIHLLYWNIHPSTHSQSPNPTLPLTLLPPFQLNMKSWASHVLGHTIWMIDIYCSCFGLFLCARSKNVQHCSPFIHLTCLPNLHINRQHGRLFDELLNSLRVRSKHTVLILETFLVSCTMKKWHHRSTPTWLLYRDFP